MQKEVVTMMVWEILITMIRAGEQGCSRLCLWETRAMLYWGCFDLVQGGHEIAGCKPAHGVDSTSATPIIPQIGGGVIVLKSDLSSKTTVI